MVALGLARKGGRYAYKYGADFLRTPSVKRAGGLLTLGAAGAGTVFLGGKALGSAADSFGSGLGSGLENLLKRGGEGFKGAGEGVGDGVMGLVKPALFIGGGYLIYRLVTGGK